MDDDDFSPMTVPQLHNHCAPQSLSYIAYYLRGLEVSQRELARTAGVPFQTFLSGMEPPEIFRAAESCGLTGVELEIRRKDRGTDFAGRLRRHLLRGNAAMLLVWDYSHWVAVLGYANGRYVVADPDNKDRAFSFWTERTLLDPGNGWNRTDKTGNSQYCALLIKRRDGKPAKWKLTDEWLRLCARGSEQKLSDLAKDIAEVARRAGGIVRNGHNGIELANVLSECEGLVCGELAHWVEADVSVRDLRRLYRDFAVTADSLRLRVPRTVNRNSIVAQMTVLLATWVWAGQL